MRCEKPGCVGSELADCKCAEAKKYPKNPDVLALFEQALRVDATAEHAEVYMDGKVTHAIHAATFWLQVVDIQGCAWHFEGGPRNREADQCKDLHFRYGNLGQLNTAAAKLFDRMTAATAGTK